jgi:hypothetical protein
MKKNQIHTVKAQDGQWKNIRAGAQRASGVYSTKAKAVEEGRKIAKRSEAEHIIHLFNGKIQNSNSYGKDPCPPVDKK